MKQILLAIMFSLAIPACVHTPPADMVTKQDAVRMARRQLVTAYPNLKVGKRVSWGGDFVPAGPHSGGGPKWVIGFATIDRKSGRKWTYYVTVFRDGRTSKDVIYEGASMGAVAR